MYVFCYLYTNTGHIDRSSAQTVETTLTFLNAQTNNKVLPSFEEPHQFYWDEHPVRFWIEKYDGTNAGNVDHIWDNKKHKELMKSPLQETADSAKVSWTSLITGVSWSGKYIPREEAIDWVVNLNHEFNYRILHWLELPDGTKEIIDYKTSLGLRKNTLQTLVQKMAELFHQPMY